MASCHESCLPVEVLHFDIVYHMTSYLLVSQRDNFVIIQNLKGNAYLRHLLMDCVLPKSVTIFLINTYTVIKRLRYFDSILVSALLVASIHRRYNLIALREYIQYPPCKSGFVVDVTRDGKLSYLNRIRFLKVSESFP
jgi:hypothetical protein